MIKARIIVNGRVQGVGYRALVKQIAMGFKVKGMARNAEEGNVELFCECDDKLFDKFLETIKIKGDPQDMLSISVDELNVYKEGNKNYVNPPTEFKTFYIDYGDKLTQFERESLERSELAIVAFDSMKKETRKGFGCVKDKIVDGYNSLKEEQKAMHQDMNKSFKESDENMNKNFNRLNETIGTKFESMDVKYGDISKTMREMHNDLREMKNLFAKLVNHIVKE